MSLPHTWPPLPIESRGWIALSGAPTVAGPWTEEIRFALRVLDPLPGPPNPPAPHLRTVADPTLPDEGYRLDIAEDPTGGASITIAARSADGARHAATTIRQLLPIDAWRASAHRRDDWRLPIVTLEDAPAWPYRGFMLDVARHFAPVPEVLRWIELAAMHRLNRLHLHLTDDQGWRIDLPSHPRLAEIASWRESTFVGHPHHEQRPDGVFDDGTPHGGCYSPADLREITEYAARHGITIVPEVDLPGHASALLAAMPELGVPGCPPQRVASGWGLLGRTVSPLPESMATLAALLAEVAELIDSPYLHIGGDEADLTMWRESPEVVALAERAGGMEELRGAVNAQLASVVTELGRRPIAWDDAFVAGGLPTDTIVMPWRAQSLGLTAAARGHDVIMAPVVPTYLDYAEAMTDAEPLALGAPQTVADAAAWVPPAAPAGSPGRVLGGQAQLWTEYLPDRAAREYRVFPRLAVLAGNLWRGTPVLGDGRGSPDDPAPADPALADPALADPALADQLARLDARHVNQRPLTGPRPWQRAGTGRRAPHGVVPMTAMKAYLAVAAQRAEPPMLQPDSPALLEPGPPTELQPEPPTAGPES